MVAPLPLRTERLTLRLFQPCDVDWLQRVFSDTEVARYLPGEPWTRGRVEEHLTTRRSRTDLDGERGELALLVENEGRPVGDIALWFTDREHRVAEIGWVLDPKERGRGYAGEAVAVTLRLAFEHHRVHRVVAQLDARNSASARLAAAVGMRQEAHHRQDCWSKGEWTDTLVFAVLCSDGGIGPDRRPAEGQKSPSGPGEDGFRHFCRSGR